MSRKWGQNFFFCGLWHCSDFRSDGTQGAGKVQVAWLDHNVSYSQWTFRCQWVNVLTNLILKQGSVATGYRSRDGNDRQNTLLSSKFLLISFLSFGLCFQVYSETHADGVAPCDSVKGQIEFVLSHANGWEGTQQSQMWKAAVLANRIEDTTAGNARLGEASLHLRNSFKISKRNHALDVERGRNCHHWRWKRRNRYQFLWKKHAR